MYLSLETCLSDSENCNILWPKQLAAFKCRLKALESTCQARFLKKRCTLRLFLFWFFPSVYETNELDDQFTILFLCSIPTEETKKRRRRSSIRGGDASRCSSIRCWNQMHRWGVSSMKHCGGLFKKDALSIPPPPPLTVKLHSSEKWCLYLNGCPVSVWCVLFEAQHKKKKRKKRKRLRSTFWS